LESLRAQLALVQQRAAAAGEFRELSEGWKRKAERLSESLAEVKANAEAQASMWKEQLQAVRVRARAEQRRASELEDHILRLGGTPVRPSSPSGLGGTEFASPTPPMPRIRSRGELVARSASGVRDGARDSGGSSEPSSREWRGGGPGGSGGVDGRSGAEKSLRDGMGKLMKGVDGKLDGVFDKMDGFAARLKRGTGALKERLVPDDNQD